MAIEYRLNARVGLDELSLLFRQQPWTCDRSAAGIATMLAHSALHVSAWDGHQLVGFARAVSDSVYRALIDDVIVDRDYQRQGIGSRLMSHICAELSEVEMVFLTCGDPVVPFYERTGFVQMNNRHMEWRRD